MKLVRIVRACWPLSVVIIATTCCGSPPPPVAAPATAPAASAAVAPTASAPVPVASVEAKPTAPPHWKYTGEEGPSKWGELWPEWTTCKTGVEQSPIDLPKKGDKPEQLVKLAASYGKLPLQILNNGHTVQVTAAPGAKLTMDGMDYELQQFHLHSPSEHTIAGSKLDGELHLVYKSTKGALAVVGLLLKKGKENKALAPVFDAAPAEESHEAKAVPNASVDLAALIPVKAAYYSYTGSLTTPPCSEGVKWYVLTKPAEVSAAQLKKFTSVLHEENARPVLPLGSRKVIEAHP
jgi:carbonic anhydrase